MIGFDDVLDEVDVVGTGLDMLGQAAGNASIGKKDKFGGKDTFNAIVLLKVSTTAFTKEALSAMVGIKAADGAEFFGYRVRIIDEDSPHDFYPLPCDLKEVVDTPANRSIAAMHTLIITTFNDLAPGDICSVKLKKIGASYDLSYGSFVEYISTDPDYLRDAKVLEKEAELCGSKSELFESLDIGFLGAFGGPQGATYNGPGGPIQITNGSLSEKGLIGIATAGALHGSHPRILKDLVPDYNRLAIAFAKHFPGKQLAGSGDRTYQRQVELAQKKPDKAAAPGTSDHGFGVAIDLHYYVTTNGQDTKKSLTYDSEEYKWLLGNAKNHGWENPHWALKGNGREEPWHWESTKKNKYITMGNQST